MAYINGENRGQAVLFPASLDEYIDDENPIRIIDVFADTLDIERLENRIEEYMNLLDATDTEEEGSERNFTKEEIEEKILSIKERKTLYEGYREEMEKNELNQISLTDSESKLMKMNGGYGAGYNVQTAVDAKHHLIAGFEVTDSPADHGLFEGLAEEVKKDFGLETIEGVADKGYRSKEDIANCLLKGIILNVPPCKGETGIGLETEYAEALITEEVKESIEPQDIKACLQAGVIPNLYKGVITGIKIEEQNYYETVIEKTEPQEAALTAEEMKAKAAQGYFVRDTGRNLVYCPAGSILRHRLSRKGGGSRYYNRSACAGCASKCTESKYKEISFSAGKTIRECHNKGAKQEAERAEINKEKPKRIKKTRKIVRFNFKPDRKKLDNRKCLSEHPFGTIKRTLNSSYLLLKGKEKARGEFALLCMVYNIKRALNILGVRKMMGLLAGNIT